MVFGLAGGSPPAKPNTISTHLDCTLVKVACNCPDRYVSLFVGVKE